VLRLEGGDAEHFSVFKELAKARARQLGNLVKDMNKVLRGSEGWEEKVRNRLTSEGLSERFDEEFARASSTWRQFKHVASLTCDTPEAFFAIDDYLRIVQGSFGDIKGFLLRILETASDRTGNWILELMDSTRASAALASELSDVYHDDEERAEKLMRFSNYMAGFFGQFRLLALQFDQVFGDGTSEIEASSGGVDQALDVARRVVDERVFPSSMHWVFFLIGEQRKLVLGLRNSKFRVDRIPEIEGWIAVLSGASKEMIRRWKKDMRANLPPFRVERVTQFSGGSKIMSERQVAELLSLKTSSTESQRNKLTSEYTTMGKRLKLWELYFPFMDRETALAFIQAKTQVERILNLLLT
jgi:hypothetical protein